MQKKLLSGDLHLEVMALKIFLAIVALVVVLVDVVFSVGVGFSLVRFCWPWLGQLINIQCFWSEKGQGN
jgi:hypothetical protein